MSGNSGTFYSMIESSMDPSGAAGSFEDLFGSQGTTFGGLGASGGVQTGSAALGAGNASGGNFIMNGHGVTPGGAVGLSALQTILKNIPNIRFSTGGKTYGLVGTSAGGLSIGTNPSNASPAQIAAAQQALQARIAALQNNTTANDLTMPLLIGGAALVLFMTLGRSRR